MLTYEESLEVSVCLLGRIKDLEGRIAADADNPFFADWVLERDLLQSARSKLKEAGYQALIRERGDE